MEKELGAKKSCLDHIYDAIETGNITLDNLSLRINELLDSQSKLNSRKQELLVLISG
jgi:hypothetical protein